MLNCDYLRLAQDDIDKMVSKLEERIQNLEEGSCIDALVLPLHGSLPPELQAKFLALHI
jgi:ATP-dependent RNA helicase DHX8/PRP22